MAGRTRVPALTSPAPVLLDVCLALVVGLIVAAPDGIDKAEGGGLLLALAMLVALPFAAIPLAVMVGHRATTGTATPSPAPRYPGRRPPHHEPATLALLLAPLRFARRLARDRAGATPTSGRTPRNARRTGSADSSGN